MTLKIRLLAGSCMLGATLAGSSAAGAERSSPGDTPDAKIAVVPEPTESPRYLHDESKTVQGSVTIGGHALAYQSEAGILVVHVKDPMDEDAPPVREDKSLPPPPQPPEAGMSYVAYFRGDKGTLTGRSPFCTTADRVRPRCGCTWARSGRSAW